ncbi:MAG: hypothetical protein JY451_06025 [Erythrobacter sp.]|nr:MAG: hypothetical protein JY451_06025 [Erythrobacter sp.]
MNLTIAPMPAGSAAASGAGAIAPAEGENGANALFSLEFAELSAAVAPELAAEELAVAALLIPASPAEAAVPGNPPPQTGGKILPLLPLGLPQLPAIAAAPVQGQDSPLTTLASTAQAQAQSVPSLTITVGTPDEAVTQAPMTPAAITEVPLAPLLPSAPPTAEKPDALIQRNEGPGVRAPIAGQPDDGEAQPQSGEGRQDRQEGKSAKPVPAAPATDRPAQGATAPAVTTAPVALPQYAASPISENTAPGFRPAATETQPQEFEAIIQRLAEARETARPASADITLLHREFGHVAMQLDMAGRQLRVSLASADADFAPAVQAALAERGPLAVVETSRSENPGGFASQQSGSGSPQPGQHRDGNNTPASRQPEPGPQSRNTPESRDPAARTDRRGSGLFA